MMIFLPCLTLPGQYRPHICRLHITGSYLYAYARRPKKKVDANKHAALSALLDAAIPASGSDSEGDSGIQILPSRNPSASSREASANTRTVTQRSEAEDTRSSKRDASTADLDINVGASTSKKVRCSLRPFSLVTEKPE